ncbi:hypothetical protein [Terriglobus sp.]|uniref:hypothetical protein n=1 Tax=Terriglobus sp. TaxID=1889013 RepID=UPI003AFF7FDA
MSDIFPNDPKPIPNDPDVIPATDADRRHDSNLSPQGPMQTDMPGDDKWTPEGDHEPVPNIPPSANDPYETIDQ